MTLADLAIFFESLAPLSLQESYDNAGIQVGSRDMELTGALLTLDVTDEVLDEAERMGFNVIVAHHPLIFGGLKSLTGRTAVERLVMRAIKSDIAIYAAHTNLDAIPEGVNKALSDRLGLVDRQILAPASGGLRKVVVFVPEEAVEEVSSAMFAAGAGHIGQYDSCSFRAGGTGTFRGLEGSDPYVGTPGELHHEKEFRLETVVPDHKLRRVLRSMNKAHPYEEVAYDVYSIENEDPSRGAGMIGSLPQDMDEEIFLGFVKERFSCGVIRHTGLLGRPVRRVAVCGGSGSFLLGKAMSAGADVFITGDMKYHQFFDADGRILIMDIGHFESEQFTRELFYDLITKNFPKFAVRLSETDTNPIKYF